MMILGRPSCLRTPKPIRMFNTCSYHSVTRYGFSEIVLSWRIKRDGDNHYVQWFQTLVSMYAMEAEVVETNVKYWRLKAQGDVHDGDL